MSWLWNWMGRNLALPAGMVFASSLAAGAYQMTETSANSYRLLRSTYDAGSESYRAALRDALAGGTLSHWVASDLLRRFLDEGHPLLITPADSSVDQERQALLHTVGVPVQKK